MKKYLNICVVIILTVAAYILLAAGQPIITSMVSTANSTTNWTLFPEAQAAVLSFPLWIWGVPGMVGLILIAWFATRKN